MPFARIFAMTAAVLFALTGCGGADPALAPREVVTRVPPEPAPPEAPGPPGPEPARTGAGTGMDRFVAAVQAKLPGVALDRRDEEVEELGRQACTALAAGKKTANIAGELRSLGVGEADARELIALAKGTACRI